MSNQERNQSSPGKDRLKIFHITAWYPSDEEPVNAPFVRAHVRAAAIHNDCSVWAFYTREDQPSGPVETSDVSEDGIRVVRTWLPFGRLPKVRQLLRLRTLIRIGAGLIRDGEPPDLIHAHTYQAGVIAIILGKRLGVPVVITEHWTGFERNLLTAGEKIKARWSMRRAQAILPVSSFLTEQIKRYGIRNRFIVVPNAIDGDTFHPPDQLFKQDRDKTGLLFVGHLIPIKGVPVMLEAVARLIDRGMKLQLDIVGGGPDQAQYEQKAADLNIADYVTFHGAIPLQDVAGMMRNADLLVHPSLIETFSCVIAEAHCCGLPVVASNIPPLPDRIDSSNGLLFAKGDVDALESAIMQIIENYDLYDRVAIAANAGAKYNPDAVGAQLSQIYRDVISSHSHRERSD